MHGGVGNIRGRSGRRRDCRDRSWTDAPSSGPPWRVECAPMHRRFALLLTALTFLVSAAAADEKPIFGFTSANAAKEHALEAQFDTKLNRDDLRAWMKRLSARPHHLGSAYDH